MVCPECNVDLKIQIPEKSYSCSGCKQAFGTVKERIEHQKSCKKLKERQFKCKFCQKEFTLDDSEVGELKRKGELNVECPSCKKNIKLRR